MLVIFRVALKGPISYPISTLYCTPENLYSLPIREKDISPRNVPKVRQAVGSNATDLGGMATCTARISLLSLL